MPLYRVERQERGERYLTFTVTADSEDEAVERIFEEDIEPDHEDFEQRDADTFVTEISTEDAVDALDDETLEDLGL